MIWKIETNHIKNKCGMVMRIKEISAPLNNVLGCSQAINASSLCKREKLCSELSVNSLGLGNCSPLSRWRVEPRLSSTETKQVRTHGLFLMVSCSCRENRFHLAIVKLKNSQWHIYIDSEQKTAVRYVFFLHELLDRK